ncbi:MAG: hypothetical protein MCS20_01915, partial [Candidatus Phytoplasma mali]|nr:hypothetical protein [Candidatus Phytoplasma australiense]MBZ7920134.1 hypothetical protein [Candidatus Karelsulcia muelleri]MCG7202146.1 hypothetical protein [Candidatus Phytoplasma mali]MCZ8632692.1 hypothetical protein [Spiroplasma sp. Tabriz.8]
MKKCPLIERTSLLYNIMLLVWRVYIYIYIYIYILHIMYDLMGFIKNSFVYLPVCYQLLPRCGS